jgi:peptidoglycan hydrolase-like protein with peptidoglycan-binding domain
LPPPSNALRPPAPVPTTGSIGGAKHVAAVQRVLTEYGYAQLKPTGILGPDTKAAIEKFERERKLPVTGQVSDHLVRELYVATGHAVE